MMKKRLYQPGSPIRYAVSAIVLSVLLLLSTACSKEEVSDYDIGDQEANTVAEGQNLVIPLNEVSETVKLYPVIVNGTEMEIIAVKDSSGNIRTAFNTCQICYSSGRGYYQQQGNLLICQNCGNQFTVEQIGIEAGGCMPYPILSADKTVTNDSILISYDFLENSRKLFLNWKSAY